MTTCQRSYNMSRIRSKDTKPELIVRHWLWSHGYRYRKNVKRLPGTPDIVLRKYGICIFVHGCFWHGHNHITYPKTNVEFWRNKIEHNIKRDNDDKQKLLNMGWNVITVWECQLKKNNVEQSMHEVEYWINRSLLIKSGDRFSMHIDHRYYPSSEETNYDIAAEPEHNGYKE